MVVKEPGLVNDWYVLSDMHTRSFFHMPKVG